MRLFTRERRSWVRGLSTRSRRTSPFSRARRTPSLPATPPQRREPVIDEGRTQTLSTSPSWLTRVILKCQKREREGRWINHGRKRDILGRRDEQRVVSQYHHAFTFPPPHNLHLDAVMHIPRIRLILDLVNVDAVLQQHSQTLFVQVHSPDHIPTTDTHPLVCG